ncbi:MAG: hypothetical protein ACLS6G_01890 [Christensenellales bacterium]
MDALIQSLVQANFAPERIAPQASMAQYTTLRIGGPAEVMVNIHSADEIAVALRAAKQADAPVTIIGNGPTCWCATAASAGWCCASPAA